MPELTVISPYKSCTFSYLLGGHHSFNRYDCRASRRLRHSWSRVADSKCQGQQGEQQKPSQTKASSQPTSRQAAGQPKRTAGPKRPSHYTGHQVDKLYIYQLTLHHTQTEHAMMCMQKQRKQAANQGRCTAAYIRAQKDKLMQSVRGPQPDLALDSFFTDMSALCSRSASCIDHTHLNAIPGAIAKAWTPAWAGLGQQKQQQARHQMHAFLTKMLQKLQPLLSDVGAREAANLLWSSAKLGVDPHALVPGMTDSLACQFMADMDAATGQGFANVLVACAKLQLSPCQGGLFKAILNQLATTDLSKFDPQNVANTLHSLVTLPAAAPSIEVLYALCKRFRSLLSSRHTCELPDAQSIANTMWALRELRHAPTDELGMCMVGRMVALSRMPGQQPTPQAISSVLLACAELTLPVKQADIDGLASFLLSTDRQRVFKQHYANTAWSLAVLGHLREEQLELLLDQLFALSVSRRELSGPSLLQDVDLRQLYPALEWLQPPQNATIQQGKAWLKLKGKLNSWDPAQLATQTHILGPSSSAQL
ncbi:TPA: hypothetical protein ACH3X2_007606 [Trebouxia sp. C0005]